MSETLPIRFFLGANSPQGFVSRFDQLDYGDPQWHTFIIKGGPGCGKSTFLKRLSSIFAERSPRMEEILTLLDQELVRSGLKNMIGAGVVLTGGTALIQGCQELGEQVFNLPTRIGYPRNVGGLKDMVNSPKFATAMGLLRFGAEKEGMEQKFRIRSDGNVFNSILSRMKKWFSEIS